MKKLILLLLVFIPQSGFSQLNANLRSVAKRSLLKNIENGYLTAGRHQFRTVWTRDFAFSVPGLLVLKEYDVVKQTLSIILDHKHPKRDVLPRGMDSINPQKRVFKQILSFVRGKTTDIPLGGKLKPEYRDQYGNFAIDGNALVAIAAHEYFMATGDNQWFHNYLPVIKRLLLFYDKKLREGLISQPKFSDWQDSVSRKGKTFYTNLLYQRAYALYLPYFSEFKISTLLELKDNLLKKFWDPEAKLFMSLLARKKYYSLEGNLLYLLWGEDKKLKHLLWEGLQASAFFDSFPAVGMATYPAYPKWMKSTLNKLVGLTDYHDSMHWSWLYGLSLVSFSSMGECQAAEDIFQFLSQLVQRDGVIYEVYSPESPYQPYNSWAYQSEWPFSWGSGLILQGIDLFKQFCQ